MEARIERINKVVEHLGITKNALAKSSGLASSNMSKMMSGEQTISDKTLGKIVEAYPQISLQWLKTGEGEMIVKEINMEQNNNTGNTMMAQSSHHLSQVSNSEKLIDKFLSGLESQSVLTKRSMTQTDKALEMMDRLISILENNNQNSK